MLESAISSLAGLENLIATANSLRVSSLHDELMEARDEIQLFNLQPLPRLSLLIIDELGFVPLSRTGAELPFIE